VTKLLSRYSGSLVALFISNCRFRLDDNEYFGSDLGSELDEDMLVSDHLDEGTGLDELGCVNSS
jgi:hypothetical protein